MGRETLKAREHDIFLAVRRWVEGSVEGCESDVVEDLVLSCVRLEALPLDKLLDDVRESKLVSDSAILDAVKIRTEKGLVSDSRAYVDDCYLSTRVEDTMLEPKPPKDDDVIQFKASCSINFVFRVVMGSNVTSRREEKDGGYAVGNGVAGTKIVDGRDRVIAWTRCHGPFSYEDRGLSALRITMDEVDGGSL